MKIQIQAQKRAAQGTGAARRLRRSGRVPGVVYGGDGGPVAIELDHKELYQNLANESFHASILTLKLDGATQDVLLRAYNMHPWRGRVQHVDFQRVSKDRQIHMKVPLHFVNAEKSPGVKEQGGIANHVVNELDISCLPDDLPEFIEVDMGELSIGGAIHVNDLRFPKGVAPVLITEEEEAAAAAEAVPAGEVPTTEQAAPDAAAAEGAAGEKGADKGAKAGDKTAAAPAAAAKPADKAAEKKEKK